MREIRFRAWDTTLNKMLDMKEIERSGMNLFALCEGVKIVKLMQYTGLKDKNGKEIFEGDLLRIIPHPDDEWEKVNYVVYEVFFHDNDCADKHIGFQMNRVHFQGSVGGTSDFINFLPKYVSKLELIGNIYENTELFDSTATAQ